MVAHGHAVPGTEVRGARPADELEVRFLLWGQKGWVPVATVARLLNVAPHTLEEALETVKGHYDFYPDAAAPFSARWLRARRNAVHDAAAVAAVPVLVRGAVARAVVGRHLAVQPRVLCVHAGVDDRDAHAASVNAVSLAHAVDAKQPRVPREIWPHRAAGREGLYAAVPHRLDLLHLVAHDLKRDVVHARRHSARDTP